MIPLGLQSFKEGSWLKAQRTCRFRVQGSAGGPDFKVADLLEPELNPKHPALNLNLQPIALEL